MFGVLGDRHHRTGILAGFLSQREHFGSLETWLDDPLYPALRLWANGDQAHVEPGAEVCTDWACIQFVNLDAPDPLDQYFAAAAREHGLPESFDKDPPAGWCSWYHFYQDISPEKIRANLRSAEEFRSPTIVPYRPSINLDLVQIDDGFQARVGDWFESSPAFPDGVSPLAVEIKAAGATPGLWLAPFILHPKSRVKNNHPEWLLRSWLGRPVNAGFIWNSFTTALDLTHPGALGYVRDVVRTAAREWSFPYLKLDYLYAAALKGRYQDRTKTRAQVLRMGLKAVREAVGPDITLLGCGVPPGSGIGIFDTMRIGADVAPRWRPEWNQRYFFFPDEPHMASTRNALQNILTRAPLHKRWWINDPDCLLVRPDMSLKEEEIHTLATAISLSGGSLLLSDNLPELPPERLEIVHRLLPLIGKTPRVIDWFDSPRPARVRLDLNSSGQNWYLAALINWEDRFFPPGRELSLPGFLERPVGLAEGRKNNPSGNTFPRGLPGRLDSAPG
jgi:alpha-galactosidase